MITRHSITSSAREQRMADGAGSTERVAARQE
jgi:hypothetical protein